MYFLHEKKIYNVIYDGNKDIFIILIIHLNYFHYFKSPDNKTVKNKIYYLYRSLYHD